MNQTKPDGSANAGGFLNTAAYRAFLKFCIRFVTVLLIAIMIFLCAQSINSTHYYYSKDTRYYVSDFFLKHLIGYFVTVAAFVAFDLLGLREKLESGSRLITGIILALTAGFMLYFLLGTQPYPMVDQVQVCQAASGLETYDFTHFHKGGYMDIWAWPQTGMVVILWGFFKIFGLNNYLAFQFLNILCAVGCSYLIPSIFYNAFPGIGRAGGGAGPAKRPPLWLLVLFFACFLPFSMYITYVYGTMLGFVLVLWGIRLLQIFLETGRRIYIVPAALLIALALQAKSNFSIFVVAIAIYLVMDILKKLVSGKSFRGTIIAIALILICIKAFDMAADKIVEARTGIPTYTGAPSICWMAMSLGFDERGNPAAYDMYTQDVYALNDFDTEKSAAYATQEYVERFKYLASDQDRFLRFFSKKIAMQWNEPTFECVHINTKVDKFNANVPPLIKRMLLTDNRSLLSKLMNHYHALLLFGVLTWLLVNFREIRFRQLFLGICFIGGFIFSIIWESGSRYMLPFFVLLIPYSAAGYVDLAHMIKERVILPCKTSSVSAVLSKDKGVQKGLVIAALLTTFFCLSSLSDVFFRIDIDDVEYSEELASIVENERKLESTLNNGIYTIRSAADGSLSIAALPAGKDEEYGPVVLSKDPSPEPLTFYHEYGYDELRFKDTGNMLSISAPPWEDPHCEIGQELDLFLWKVIPSGVGTYAITYEGYALTLTPEGGLTLVPFSEEGLPQQQWVFEKVG